MTSKYPIQISDKYVACDILWKRDTYIFAVKLSNFLNILWTNHVLINKINDKVLYYKAAFSKHCFS